MGEGLVFSCECGFVSHEVWIGCGFEGVYHDPAICLKCHKIFAMRRKGENPEAPSCRNCHKKCVLLTDPGAWGPRELQELFPGADPFRLLDGGYFEKQPTGNILALLSQFGILCPQCHKLTLKHECCVLWD